MDTHSLANFNPLVASCQFWGNRILVASISTVLFCSNISIGQDNRGIALREIDRQDNQPALTGARAFVSSDTNKNEFGIGYATFMLREGDEAIERINAAELVEADNRIFYSFVEAPALRKLKTFLQIPMGNQIRAHKIWFLFKSSDTSGPLRLRMRGSGESRELRVEIEACKPDPFERKYAKKWRKQFIDAMAAQRAVNDYPPILEDYLESMLLGRVRAKKEDSKNKKKGKVKSLSRTVGVLLDLESTRNDLIAESMNPLPNDRLVRTSLPQPIELPVKRSPVSPQTPVVEEIAKVVPASCFYLRFGNWNNQIWLKGLIEEYGGDLSRMLTVRGYKNLVQSKFLEQLCVQSGPLDKWFGGTKVNDVALIGSDFYFRSGAGVGVVLQAQPNQTESLRKNFENKRKKIVQEARERIFQRLPRNTGLTIDDIDSVWQGVSESREFAGHDVNFIETRLRRADVKNENVLKATLEERVIYRSYYVVKGDFHLITTSVEIVKQFLAIQNGKSVSLAESQDFRAFRSKDPFNVENNNRILFFASNAFLRNLFKPGFQIELARRNRLSARIQVLEMATLAAANEGVRFFDADNVIAQLIDGKFLPKGFDLQGLERNGQSWVDQERGRFGFFKPLADVTVEDCTRLEFGEYEEIKAAVGVSIRNLEPVYFHLDRRKKADDDGSRSIEIVSFDSRITAIGEDDLDWALGRLGPKMESEIEWGNAGKNRAGEEESENAPPIVKLNLSLKKKPIFKRNFDYRLFLVVDDDAEFDPQVDLKAPSVLQQILAEVPGFVAAQPAAGVLDWFFPEGRRESVVDESSNLLIVDEGGNESTVRRNDKWVIRESKLLISPLYRLSESTDAAGDGAEVRGFNAVSYNLARLQGLELKNLKIPLDDRCQFHLEINELAPESNINRWVNSINYRRSWQTSIANVKFMNFVSRQLGTDPRKVQAICQDLLGVELVCSLGGSYKVVKTGGGIDMIFSDAWPDFKNPELPKDYQAPVLGWFRGCDLRLSKEVDGERFELTGTLEVERAPAGFALPVFEGFKGLFGGGQK